MYDDTEYMFKGCPDFTVHFKSDTTANRILMVMGEVQSIRDPMTQNAIYAVGTLSKTPLKGIIGVNSIKNKSATTSITRLRAKSPSDPQNALGTVTLKYFMSPHAVDLTQPHSITELAKGLNVYTNNVRI